MLKKFLAIFREKLSDKRLERLVFQRNLKWYIYHYDDQTPTNGTAIFGPFSRSEIVERMNDAFADALASYGTLEEFQMTDDEAAKFYINTREYWLEQAADLTDD